jgi:hypothetical protein
VQPRQQPVDQRLPPEKEARVGFLEGLLALVGVLMLGVRRRFGIPAQGAVADLVVEARRPILAGEGGGKTRTGSGQRRGGRSWPAPASEPGLSDAGRGALCMSRYCTVLWRLTSSPIGVTI